jgi:hypothetical protein
VGRVKVFASRDWCVKGFALRDWSRMEGRPREIRKALEGGGWWFYEAKRGDAETRRRGGRGEGRGGSW